MFIHIEILITVLILSILGIVCFRSYYVQQIRQWYSMYSEINDKYRKVSAELSEYKRTEFLKENLKWKN